jgi:hypothetical protein
VCFHGNNDGCRSLASDIVSLPYSLLLFTPIPTFSTTPQTRCLQSVFKLEVVQSPSRGRTCGFGDADRRALSAPLIARLRLFRRFGDAEVELDAK